MHRQEDEAVHFCIINENLQNQFRHCPHWSDSKWKVCLAGGGGDNRRLQYCTDASGTIFFYLRALQDHSGRNLIDPSLQNNVVIQSNFFLHLSCRMCFNLHSIVSSGLISGGQSSSKKQTAFFLFVDPVDESHKDPDVID